MIDVGQVVNGVWVGAVLIAIGLVPGLLQGIVHGLDGAARNLRRPLSARFANTPRLHVEVDSPSWLAAMGAAIIVATLLAYLAY